MRKAGKWLVLAVAVALIAGVVVTAGCTTTTPTTTTQPTVQKKIGVQSGTTGESWAKENLKGASVVPFKTATEAFSALAAGNVDAVVNDLPVTAYLAKDPSRGITIIAEVPTGEQYGFGVSKDNPGLTAAINYGLAK